MVGSKLLLAVSLLLLALAPVGALAPDIKTQSSTLHRWYNDPFQRSMSLGELVDGGLNGPVSFPGKAAFRR